MQCIWQSLAQLPPNAFRRAPSFFSNARPVVFCAPRYTSFSFPRSTRNISQSLHSIPLLSQPPPILSTSSSTLNPTPPSRPALSAAKAIRVSLKEHALEDAFMIVDRIRNAALPGAERKNNAEDIMTCPQVTVLRGVSPRLPVHTLLHGLVRLKMPQKASQLATSMMLDGIQIHGKTLEKIMGGLFNATTVKKFALETKDAPVGNPIEGLLESADVLNLDPSTTSDPNTASGLELLRAASQSKNQRTSAMFSILITLCLINGEIILASLLYGFLAKEGERTSQTLSYMTAPISPVKPSPQRRDLTATHYLYRNLQPTHELLKGIVLPIQERLARATPDDVHTPYFQEAIQALANLATPLHDRQLPFPEISCLLRALYRCPKVDNWVWVETKGQQVSVPAYAYFHRILLNLARSLPTDPPQTRAFFDPVTSRRVYFKLPHPVHHIQPPLDLDAYNSLIHYAMRHRFSPSLAKKIYDHMISERNPPLSGISIDTFSILLRSSALHHRRDVVAPAVKFLSKDRHSQYWKEVNQKKPKRTVLHRNLKEAQNNVDLLPPLPSVEEIFENNHSLSTYLSTLMSCGQADLVAALMRSFFPIFQPKVRVWWQYRENKQRYMTCLNRAVKLGPHVLCILLHSLVKSGLTEQAHRFFMFIVRASQRSRQCDEENTREPWRVSVPIYTTALRAYEQEFDRRRRSTGIRLFRFLLLKTTMVYRTAKADVAQNLPGVGRLDARFYSAILKILSEFLPTRQRTFEDARTHLARVRRHYVETGYVNTDGRVPLLEEIVADLSSSGYPVPIGFHYLFVNERPGILGSSLDVPELQRRPFAFPKATGSSTPYTLPVPNNKAIFFLRRGRRKRKRLKRRWRIRNSPVESHS